MPIVLPIVAAGTIALTRPRSGVSMSTEGEFAKGQVTQIWNRFDETITFQSPHMELLAELETLEAEHSLPGWDGNQAPPVSYSTVENAREFIAVLPAETPTPELAVDPDNAAVSFEWHGGYRRVFSVSIGESGRLACAGLDGTDQWHAALSFTRQLPRLVGESIRRVMS